MILQETTRQEEIQSLKQLKFDQASESLMVLEFANLIERWQHYASEWTGFRETTEEELTELHRMIEAKLDTLEGSNKQLQSSMDSKLRAFTGTLTGAADAFSTRLDSMTAKLETAATDYISQIREDARQGHARNDQYWHSRHKRNIGVILYLLSTPALVIIAFLSRFFGWF